MAIETTDKDQDQEDESELKEIETVDQLKENWPTTLSEDCDTHDVAITNKDGSVVIDGQLRELLGTDRENFLRDNRNKLNRDGSIKEFKDVQVILLSRTFFDKATNKPVDLEILRKLPSKTQQMLYEMSIKLSALDKEALLRAKKK